MTKRLACLAGIGVAALVLSAAPVMAAPIDIGTFSWNFDSAAGGWYFEVDNNSADSTGTFSNLVIQLFSGATATTAGSTEVIDLQNGLNQTAPLNLGDLAAGATATSFAYDLSAGQGLFDSAQLEFTYGLSGTVSGSDVSVVPIELDLLFDSPLNTAAVLQGSTEIFFTPATSVPEPQTMLLFGLGVVAIAAARIRDRRRVALRRV